jgi:ParB family chromosome partitioning protein
MELPHLHYFAGCRRTQLLVRSRAGGHAEEDSLAENVDRENLHPLDQFCAFQTLRDEGLSEEEIAARSFASTAVS